MIIVIPLGGIGKRFTDLGYTVPKPLIKVLGKEIIFWVLDNLKINKKDKIYIVYNKDLDKNKFTDYFGKYPFINFLRLNNLTQGPVETIYELTKIIEKNHQNEGLLIVDGDTFYRKNIIKNINKKKNTIFYHSSKIKEPIFSYIKLRGKKVVQIREKIKISNNANTGAYYFNSIKKFNFFAFKLLKKNKKIYVSDIYKKLIETNDDVFAQKLLDSEFSCLGTPKQVIEFCNKEKIEKKRFCFDLDNTLVTFPSKIGDYDTAKPILRNIKFLNYLYSLGHYIIIFTARRMRTHNGNISKVIKDIKQITIRQLKKFDIKYHKLIFGKPYAHYYIDDLSIHPFENLNTKLGYYEKLDSKTNKFNKIIIGEKFTIKNSINKKVLQDEIKYMNKIPTKLKIFFPKVINFEKNSYKMETVNGIKLSYLLINNLLTKDDILSLYTKLNYIHNFKKIKNNYKFNIYSNYSKKFNARIKSNKKLFTLISKKKLIDIDNNLKKYEKLKLGKVGIIHGDPILGNIIKKNDNEFIFLDPKGSLYNNFSLYGDVNYDFAKVYQSLTGYENIISEKRIDFDYLNELKNYFENLLTREKKQIEISNLRYLTSSLYVSLFNFHDKKYISKFIKIVDNLI